MSASLVQTGRPASPGLFNNFDPVAAHMRDHFGLAIHPEDISQTQGYMPHESTILPTGYNRPWSSIPTRRHPHCEGQPPANINIARDGTFQVCVDVHHFKPNEIHVKTVNNIIFIEGNHEERSDDHGHGSSTERRFVRKYTLPQHYNSDHISSTLSSDGVLTVSVPPPPPAVNQRVVPVHHTGPAHLSVKESQASEEHSNGANGNGIH